MKTNKIDKNVVIDTIQKEADVYFKKMNIYEQVKDLNHELKSLYENGPMIQSFGFKSDSDTSNKLKTGFEKSQNISFIAQLEKEMEENNDSALNEVEVLKQEKEVLRGELESLRKELEELKSTK